jgi:hypothetical protein
VRIRDLERSRSYWRTRALAAEGKASASGACGGEAEVDRGEGPSLSLVPTRVANHHHSLEVMQLSLQLYLHASFGCRGVSWVLRLLAGYLPLSVPASTTVLNWCCRLGLAVLQRLPARRDDWIFVIDETVGLGELKCLVVLGIPAARLAETGYSPRHCDMTVLAVEVTANSTGVWVAAVLQQVSARSGVPVQIVSDHGSDVRKGIALFRQQAPSCVETYDISHAVATQLKAHWRDDAHWQGFLKQAGATLSHFQQTDLGFLLPPRQRTKARYMAMDSHLDWAQRLIGYHDQGDFSAIGRPCVFTGAAYARLRARWGKPRVEPVRGLIGTQYDTRAALCEALRAAGATALDDLDDAFWRLADRGYARFLEAFAWVLPYRDRLARVDADDRRVQDRPDGPENPGAVARHTGGGAGGAGRARTACTPGGRLSARGSSSTSSTKRPSFPPVPPGWHPPISSNRSLVITKPSPARGPLKEVGRLVLLIPAFLSELTAPVIREAMASVRTL